MKLAASSIEAVTKSRSTSGTQPVKAGAGQPRWAGRRRDAAHARDRATRG